MDYIVQKEPDNDGNQSGSQNVLDMLVDVLEVKGKTSTYCHYHLQTNFNILSLSLSKYSPTVGCIEGTCVRSEGRGRFQASAFSLPTWVWLSRAVTKICKQNSVLFIKLLSQMQKPSDSSK